jgi:hypothetical protein
MTPFVTIRLLLVLLALIVASGQARSGPTRPGGRASEDPPGDSKTHDREWLKSQLRRRYGTSSTPDKDKGKKTPPATKPTEKPPSPKSTN